MGRCDGRVAIVTGATRGIGQMLTVRLAAEGALVLAVGRTLEPTDTSTFAGSLRETLALVDEVGGRAEPVVADISNDADRRSIFAASERLFGTAPTILVNNVAAPRAFDLRFDTMTEEVFRTAIDVNIWAAWALAILAVPGMRAAGVGHIVNISSRQSAPRLGPPYVPSSQGGACLYGSSKAMIDRLTSGAAMDLYDDNIAVNALAPESAVMTPLAASLGVPAAAMEPIETFAEAALALCTADPKVLTGQICYSLGLVRDLGLAVHTLDGRELFPGWQPDDIDEGRLFGGYLRTPS
jgi:citronellol/citronellal dehydrogenase